MGMYECDIDPFHADAFLGDCDSATFGGTGSDVYGTCPEESTRKVHLKNLLIGNKETDYWASGVDYRNKIIYRGDKLTWKWKVTGGSTLWKFSTEEAFKTCNFAQATELKGAQGGGYFEYV